MADTKITNRIELEAWLADKPREWAQVIAITRSAEGSAAGSEDMFGGKEISETKLDLTLAIFRANFISWMRAQIPANDHASATTPSPPTPPSLPPTPPVDAARRR